MGLWNLLGERLKNSQLEMISEICDQFIQTAEGNFPCLHHISGFSSCGLIASDCAEDFWGNSLSLKYLKLVHAGLNCKQSLVKMHGNVTLSNIESWITKTISEREATATNARESLCKHSISICILLVVASLTVVVGVIYIVGKIIRSKSTRSRHFLFQYIPGEASASGTRTHLYISGNRKT